MVEKSAIGPRIFPDKKENESNLQDKVFVDIQPLVTDFQFDKKTADVFDDMVGRSVPFYHEIQRMICEITADFAVEGTNLYDLGCSTGTTLLALDQVVRPDIHFIGVDNSGDRNGCACIRRREQRLPTLLRQDARRRNDDQLRLQRVIADRVLANGLHRHAAVVIHRADTAARRVLRKAARRKHLRMRDDHHDGFGLTIA